MTITITAPLTTPANIVATPQAGGSLAASTRYYYRRPGPELHLRLVYAGLDASRSDWSPEQYFDTDSTNKQAAITWDAVTGATGYVIIMSTVSGNYTGSKRLGASSTCSDRNYQ